MHHRRDPGRPHRVDRAEQTELDEARPDLGRPNQGGGGNRRRLAGAGTFEKARQMRRHRAGDERRRAEIKAEDRHRAARRLDG